MKLHLFAATLAIASCTKKKEDQGGASAPPPPTTTPNVAAPKPADELPPEPVAKQPSPNPAPMGDDVRPPVAADLVEYTKDLPGSGSKLLATIDTSLGTFHCQLYGDKAPMTVANFVGLATGKKPWLDPNTTTVQKGKPYYDGQIFHRVIPTFMIQGGDPLGKGVGGPGYQFADEISDLKMQPGVLAMANTGLPVTNGSQFFITEGSPDWLNGKHTIFGQCKEVELVKKITHVPATSDRPNEPITVNKVTISRG